MTTCNNTNPVDDYRIFQTASSAITIHCPSLADRFPFHSKMCTLPPTGVVEFRFRPFLAAGLWCSVRLKPVEPKFISIVGSFVINPRTSRTHPPPKKKSLQRIWFFFLEKLMDCIIQKMSKFDFLYHRRYTSVLLYESAHTQQLSAHLICFQSCTTYIH